VSSENITAQKRDRAYALAVHEIPKMRAIGLGILAIAVYVHNRFLLHDASIEAWALLTAGFILYAGLTAVATSYFYRARHVDLTLPFLIGDVVVLTLAVYVSGAENSWLYPVVLTKVADQTQTTYRRCLMFTVLTTVAYSMMLLFVSVVHGRHIDLAVMILRPAIIAAFGLYIALMARIAERRRERLTEAVRKSRELIGALEQQSVELRDAQARSESASAAKSEFLANVSHEMRTPLHGIMGMLQLASDSESSPERRHQLQMAIRSAESLLTTIEDILDFTKIEARKLELEPVYFSVRELVADTLKTLGVTAAQKGLQLAFAFDTNVPDRLWGDPLRLRQILINLVGNAIKFTALGEIVVRCAVDATFGGDVTLRFSVKDTGTGIDTHKRDVIFHPFAQADSSHSRRYGGTGLGLSIVARLVDAMGGTIHVDSEPGSGSTFTFTVKLAHDEIDGVVAPQWHAALAGMRVLIVEPHATSREIIGNVLRANGVVPEAYATLDEALQPSIREAFSCVVIDARVLAGTPWIPPVPVVEIITPISSVAHNVPTVTRPIAERELLDAIGVALGVIDKRVAYTLERRVDSERPLTVLVVDDHPVNLEFAAEALRRLGHLVVKASSGEEAVALVRTRNFDVALVDIQMPEMNGFEVLRRFRAIEAGARVRMIALTAYTSHEDRDLCFAAGFHEVLTKPVTQSRLAALLSGRAIAGDPVIDAVGGNMKLLARVRDAFASQSPKLMATIRTAITDADADMLYRTAHTLKGAISNFGDGDALAAAIDIERAGKVADFKSAESLLPMLEAAIRDLDQRMAEALERVG
jgi:two-component system sensor histidine kinase/response regulator